MRFIDLHCDTLTSCVYGQKGGHLRKTSGQLDLERLKQAGAMAQVFAVFIPPPKRPENAIPQARAYFSHACTCLLREMNANKDIAALAYCGDDIRANDAKGLLSILLSVEDCALLDGDRQKISLLYRRGVRLMTLTWNFENSLGYPNSPIPADTARGLKPFGKEAVALMQKLGILVDVSHLSDGGFWDVVELSKAAHVPFTASHSCARALCQHPRNLTDDMLRAIGETGSVCGINFCAGFLSPTAARTNYTKIEDIVRCARYLRDKAGIDAVALGSDFDGIDSKLEFTDCAGLPALADALAFYFPEEEVEKICWRNALRVIDETMKA